MIKKLSLYNRIYLTIIIVRFKSDKFSKILKIPYNNMFSCEKRYFVLSNASKNSENYCEAKYMFCQRHINLIFNGVLPQIENRCYAAVHLSSAFSSHAYSGAHTLTVHSACSRKNKKRRKINEQKRNRGKITFLL